MINSPITILLFGIQSIVGILLAFSALFVTLAILNCGKIKKGKFILGLLIYGAINQVVNFVTGIVSSFSLAIVDKGEILKKEDLAIKFVNHFDSSESIFGQLEVLNVNAFFLTIGAVIGLYLFARFIIKHKLELE